MAVRLSVKVTPRAAREEIQGWQEHVLKVRLTAVPEQGRANAALESLLARTLGVAKSGVSVISGHSARTKLVAIDSLDAAELERRLAAAGWPRN